MARQRIQFFLDDDQYDAVTQIATTQDRPIPDLVHDLVDLGLEKLKGRARDRQKALHRLAILRNSVEARHGLYLGDPVAEVRAERERQVNDALSTAAKP